MTHRTTQEDKTKAAGAVALVKAQYASWQAAGYRDLEPVLTAAKVAALLGFDLDVHSCRRSAIVGLVRSRLEAAVRRGELGRSQTIDHHHRDVVAYDDPEVTR